MNGVIQKYDRTAQLLDKDNIVDGGAFYPSVTGNKMITSNNTLILLLPCKPNTTYTISRRNVITKRFVMCFLTSNEIYADMPIYSEAHDDTALTLTSTSTAESQYLCFYYAKSGGSDSSTSEEIQSQLAEIMINEGSTALPYQPYLAFKDIPYTRLETATDTITALPKTTYNDGTSATVAIKGNTVQNGTPTSSNPVEVNGVGVRTANLLDSSKLLVGYHYNQSGSLTPSQNRMALDDMIDVSNINDVVITYDFASTLPYARVIVVLYSNGVFIEREAPLESGATIDTSQADKISFAFYSRDTSAVTPDNVYNIMLNIGSTAKPYEPYGYKIPISSGGVTTNIYLGSTQTVRQVKKLVLTGEEPFSYAPSGNINRFKITLTSTAAITNIISTHYKYEFINAYGNAFVNSTLDTMTFCDDYSSETDFKSYLATQYAAGTPVTVWYVLATPETAAVNEPLMKIGDYVDTVSNPVTIPTTSGGQTFDVSTTLKPSEVDLTYHGWHEHEAEKYSRTENLFDKDNDVEKFYVRASDGTYKSSTGNSYSAIIPCVAGTAYAITTISKTLRVGFYATKPVDGTSCIESFNNNNSSYTSRSVTYTASTNATYMAIYAYQDGDEYSDGKTLDDIYGVLMVNTGSTAKPYQPYLDWE